MPFFRHAVLAGKHKLFTFLFFLSLCASSIAAFADAIPQELELRLKPGPLLCCSPDVMAIELIITNTSHHDASIIVPGHPRKGLHLFRIAMYERTPETMKWVHVADIQPIDTLQPEESKRYELFWRIKAGEQFKQLLFINRPKSEHFALQVSYVPAVSALYRYAFVNYDEEGVPDSTVNLAEKPDLLKAQGSFTSALCTMTTEPMAKRIADGRVARAIYAGKENKLLRQLRRGKPLPKEWPVLNKQLYSQTVNMSLPTYSHQYLTVDTKEGVQHLLLNYRLGKIYRFRSRMASIAHHMLHVRRVFWKTSDAEVTRLLYIRKV